MNAFDTEAGKVAKELERRSRLEIAICGLLLASFRVNHNAALARVTESDIAADDFGNDDTRAIYIAWHVAAKKVSDDEDRTDDDRRADLTNAIRLCRAVLTHGGHWDDMETAMNLTSARWSESKVTHLSTRWQYENSKLVELLTILKRPAVQQ